MHDPSISNLARSPDLERNDGGDFLLNQTVQSFSWQDLTVTVRDRETKKSRDLISAISGEAQRGMFQVQNLYQSSCIDIYSTGELVALMGPSGCGKTTLLNVLARRAASSGATVIGETYVNDSQVDAKSFQRMTSYVEQEDALIGSLTVQETLKFAADLSLPRYVTFQLKPSAPPSSTDCDLPPTVPYPSSSAWRESKLFWKHLVSRSRQKLWLEPPSERESVVARSGG